MTLTAHQRHKRVQDKVRSWYQETYPGSRLFHNQSGTGWAGISKKIGPDVIIKNPFFVQFGIPNKGEGHGGADLIGWHKKGNVAIFLAVEVKTGKAFLQENQKNFMRTVSESGGLYFVARECNECKGQGCGFCGMKGWDFE